MREFRIMVYSMPKTTPIHSGADWVSDTGADKVLFTGTPDAAAQAIEHAIACNAKCDIYIACENGGRS